MDEDLRKKIASLLVDLSLGKTSITKTNYEIMALIASYTEKEVEKTIDWFMEHQGDKLPPNAKVDCLKNLKEGK